MPTIVPGHGLCLPRFHAWTSCEGISIPDSTRSVKRHFGLLRHHGDPLKSLNSVCGVQPGRVLTLGEIASIFIMG